MSMRVGRVRVGSAMPHGTLRTRRRGGRKTREARVYARESSEGRRECGGDGCGCWRRCVAAARISEGLHKLNGYSKQKRIAVDVIAIKIAQRAEMIAG